MFFNQTATVYKRAYDGNRVSTWSSLGTISCKVIPLWGKDNIKNINDAIDFDGYKLYTRDLTIKPWYKIVVWGDTYFVKKKDENNGLLSSFGIYIVNKSQWS